MIIVGGGLVGYQLLKQNGIDPLSMNMEDLEPYIGEHAENIKAAYTYFVEEVPKLLEEYTKAK